MRNRTIPEGENGRIVCFQKHAFRFMLIPTNRSDFAELARLSKEIEDGSHRVHEEPTGSFDRRRVSIQIFLRQVRQWLHEQLHSVEGRGGYESAARGRTN